MRNGNRKTAIAPAVDAGLPAQKPEPAVPPSLGGDHQGKAHCGRCAVLRITRKSTHLLDDDNLPGSYKFLRDWLCDCGLIKGDAPHQLKAEYTQEKVRHKKDAGTIVVVEYVED